MSGSTSRTAEHRTRSPSSRTTRRPSALWTKIIVAIGLVACLLPSMIRPAEFMQDDSYFYLQVAHNIAQGLGSTFHGITPTNGYHPLWLWMVALVSTVTDADKTLTLYLVFVLQAMLVISAMFVLRRLASLMSLRYWLIGLAVLAAYLLGTAIYGSEAHVNALSLLASLACLWTALERQQSWRWFLTGIVFGIALLARLDNIFVIGGLSALAVFHAAGGNLRQIVARAISLGIGGAMVVVPYLAGNYIDYGHLVPISGAIKSTFPSLNPDWHNLGTMGKLATPFGLVGVLTGLLLDKDPKRRVIWLGLGTGVLIHAVYIVCYTDHYTFWAWYYVPAVITAALSASYIFGWVMCRFPSLLRPDIASRAAFLLTVAVLSAGSARAWIKGFGFEGIGPLRVEIKINKYRWPDEFGRWMKKHFPAGTRIFVYDWPGAIAYYSDLPLLPMDGLMNDFQYNDDLVRVGIHSYLCAHDVRYFFGLIEPWQRDVEVVVTAPLYRTPVGTLYLEEEDIVVRTDDVLDRPEEALPFAIWKLDCKTQSGSSELS
jgi:hypothetical protein